MRWCWCLVLVTACETVDPTPVEPTPVPVDAAALDAAVLDAPFAAVDLQCSWIGPKEAIRIRTDVATGTGTLERFSAQPIPDRRIRYRTVATGPGTVDLVFAGYEPGDYARARGRRHSVPRERLVAGTSVVARVFVAAGGSRIAGVDVDLHTGLLRQYPDHAYPCRIGP